MRKIFLFAAALIIGASVFAQPSKGDIILKGNIGYTTQGILPYSVSVGHFSFETSASLNELEINPQIEYFLSDRSSVGLSVGYQNSWERSKSESSIRTLTSKEGLQSYYIGGTYNYYIPLSKSFSLSFNCYLGYMRITEWATDIDNGLKQKDNVFGNYGTLSFTPTINYFINGTFLLTASIGHAELSIGKYPAGGDYTQYTGGINWSDIRIGVGFIF